MGLDYFNGMMQRPAANQRQVLLTPCFAASLAAASLMTCISARGQDAHETFRAISITLPLVKLKHNLSLWHDIPKL